MIDTGAASNSTGGIQQFRAYQNVFGSIPLLQSSAVTVKFGVGLRTSIGLTTISTPFSNAVFYIVDVDTPFLLLIKDMDRLKVRYDNLADVIEQPGSGKQFPIIRKFGHPFFIWGPMIKRIKGPDHS